MSNNNQYVLIAGLPRTGSTLLINILLQNSKFHADSNSALCQLMWDTNSSIDTSCKEQLIANRKLEAVKFNVLSSLPDIYYSNVTNKIILDKCRAWTKECNFKLAKNYIDKNVKVIVLVRPIDKIVKSFAKMRKDINETCLDLFHRTPEVLLNSYIATLDAIDAKSENIMFISYSDMTSDTDRILNEIYDFINLDRFNHDLNNISASIDEDSSVYKYKNLHKIRSEISVEDSNFFVIPDDFKASADNMSDFLELGLKEVYHGSFC